jgi:hypothetical protein
MDTTMALLVRFLLANLLTFFLVETIPIPNDVQQYADSKNFEVKAYK